MNRPGVCDFDPSHPTCVCVVTCSWSSSLRLSVWAWYFYRLRPRSLPALVRTWVSLVSRSSIGCCSLKCRQRFTFSTVSRLRFHVKKEMPKIKKRLWKCVGGSSVQLEIIKKIGKHIFIHYHIPFFGEHSNVNNVINALLSLCSCFYVQVFVFNYFEISRNFFGIDGWVGAVYRIQTFFGF